MREQTETNRRGQSVMRMEDSPVAKSLFGDVRWAWLWLILRLYIGYEWLSAGWEKWHSASWTGSSAGSAIAGFVNGAIQQTSAHPNVQGWYAWFLQHAVLPAPAFWGYLISTGELLVGIALILGLFTGVAAFFGSFMNMNYLLAGAVSTNPILFAIATWLVLAWKTAGWWGLDRWVLPVLGTPWSPGLVFQNQEDGGRRPKMDQGHHPEHATS
jgi:thiosulfate dehydrogenase [quinone] large subunit